VESAAGAITASHQLVDLTNAPQLVPQQARIADHL
jgi:hypothetical protein